MINGDLIIDVSTLSDWLRENRPVTVLDVRPLEQREEWAITGSVHADIYDKLKNGDEHVFDSVEFRRDQPIVTVCAAGKTSLIAAELLKQKGYSVYSLKGGMKEWNFAFDTAEVVLQGVKIIQVRRSAKGVLSYIIGSNGEALVVDAALDPQVYLGLAAVNGWSIKFVTDTHIHADYLSRTRELAKVSKAKHLLINNAGVTYPFTSINDGDHLSIGNAIIEVIYTPGHTLESTSFKIGENALLTGDTLFIDGVGRPDLKANSDEIIARAKLLYHSIHKLLRLNPDTLVLPAHLATTVQLDGKLITASLKTLKDKLHILKLAEDEFVDYTRTRIPPTPPNYLIIAALNKQGAYEGHNRTDLEAGANRCAIA
jgi:glyoxylase-like metal-dependent hydrolase (beta-lactamase superfamily II)/rhodanese-related sulfurtransferase